MHISQERPQDELSPSAAVAVTFRNPEQLQREMERVSPPVVVWDGRHDGPGGAYLFAKANETREAPATPGRVTSLPSPTPRMTIAEAIRRVVRVLDRVELGAKISILEIARSSRLTEYHARRAVAAVLKRDTTIRYVGLVSSGDRGRSAHTFERVSPRQEPA